jgi:hypothetical protein
MEERLWIYDPKILFINYKDIYPTETNNNINAIARYFLLTTIIFITFASYKWAYICGIGFVLTTLIGYIYTKNEDKEDKIKKIKTHLQCRRSTINNPMGNLMPLDEDPTMEACMDDPQEKIDNNLYYNFYEDENDLKAKTRLRNFITMPVSSILGNRNSFLKFAYGDNMSRCKYDGVRCERARDIRYSK